MKVYCSLPFHRMKINSDGGYHSCCHQKSLYGNLITENVDIKEGFNNHLLKSVQQAVRENRLHDLCNTPKCPLYSNQDNLEKLATHEIEVDDQPIDIEMALPSAHCNIGGINPTADTACSMCPRASKTFMDLEPAEDLIDDILNKIKPFMNKIRVLNIQGIAEPFWKGRVLEILERLDFEKYRDAIHFWTFTNGTVFGDKIQDEFIKVVKYGSLGFSIDAATPETYVKIRKLNYFKTIERNLKRYVEKTKHLKNEDQYLHSFTSFNINMINVHEMEQMVRWSHSLGLDRTEFTLTFVTTQEFPMGIRNICNKSNWKIFWGHQQRAIEVAKELNYEVTFYVPFHGGFLNT